MEAEVMTDLPAATPPDAWARREPLLVLAMAVLLFVANLVTARNYPLLAHDDAMMIDPAINLYRGDGFTSAAWPLQKKEEIYGGNFPLYPLALAGWLKLFGFSHETVRAFTYLCGSLALVCLWWALRRAGWIPSARWRLAFLATLFLSYPVCLAYRCNRYDSLQILLCSLVLAVWVSSLRPRVKAALLMLGGALVLCSGVQAGVYLGMMCVAAMLWRGKGEWRNAAATIAGLGLGAVAMFVYLYTSGALHAMVAHREWLTRMEAMSGGPWRARFDRLGIETAYDPALILLALALGVILTQAYRSWPSRDRRRLACWSAGLVIGIMAGLDVAVHFIRYYRWMTLLPLAVITFAALARAGSELSRARRWTVFALLAGMAATGWPFLQVYGAIRGFPGQLRALDALARRELRPGDVVFGEYAASSVVRPLTRRMYFPGYLEQMSPAEEREVTVLIVQERHFGSYYWNRYGEFVDRFSKNGARWEKVAEVPYTRGRVLSTLARFAPASIDRYETRTNLHRLTFYRRQVEPAR